MKKRNKLVFCKKCIHYFDELCIHPDNLFIANSPIDSLKFTMETPQHKNMYNDCESYCSKKMYYFRIFIISWISIISIYLILRGIIAFSYYISKIYYE